MKKSTLIVVVVAIALGAFVYFYDSKHNPKPASAEEPSKAAFSVKPAEISSLTLHQTGGIVSLSKKGSQWNLTQPVETLADQTAVGGLVSDLTDLKIQRSFSPTDNLSKYGLADPKVKIEFQQTNGSSHNIQLGDTDFSNTDVYALIDGSKQIDMLPTSLLDDSEKPVSQLRDRSLIDLNGSQVTAVILKDASGDVTLSKAPAGWEISRPRKTLADSGAIDSLVSSLSNNKFTDVVSETPADLAKYGLQHPAVTLDVTAQGGKQFHLLLSKKDTNYYGRDLARPMIFRVDAPVYQAFDKKFFDLRDKSILQFDPTAVTAVTIQNPNGTVECLQGKDDLWSVVEPVADKGKQVQSWKMLDPLQNVRATQIYDAPSAAILAHLKKPAIQVTLKDKSNKTTTIQISAASSNSVYIRTSAGPEVYEANTQILTDLGFKVSDLLI
ncbi:MAG: DUF4340 domain-containing protein [Candidatus Acidiferrales bacterium]